MADIPTKIYDEAVKDIVNFDKYSTDLNKKVQRLLEQTQNEIVAAIAVNDPTAPTMTKWKLARLEKLNEDISIILKSGYGSIKTYVDSSLKSMGTIQASNVVNSLNKSIGADIFNVTLTQDEVVGIVNNTMIQGNIIGQWWDKQSADVQAKLSAQMAAGTQAIQIGLMQGESVGDLINRVRGTKLTPGIMSVTKREATALVRTSVMQVANAVRMETYKKNRDIMDGIVWCSTLDARTTPLCQALDGLEWDMELNPINHEMEYPGGPPAHWQCRSTILPITVSWKSLAGSKSKLSNKQLKELDKIPVGERASMGGLVPSNMNYNSWLLTQSKEVQQDILGVGKWQLWSENKLSVTDLVDNTGNPLTLEQLREKFGILEMRAPTDSVVSTSDSIIAGDWIPITKTKDAAAIFKSEFNIKELVLEDTLSLDAVNACGRGLTHIKTLDAFAEKPLPAFNRKPLRLNILDKKFLWTDEKGWDSRRLGQFRISEKRIYMAGKGRENWADQLRLSEGQWLAGGDLASVMRHEYGHYIHENYVKGIELSKWTRLYNSNPADWWKDNVTTYSAKNAKEAFAESFSAYTSPLYGLDKGKRLPIKIESYMESVFGKNNFLRSETSKHGDAIAKLKAEKDAAVEAAKIEKEKFALLSDIKNPDKSVTFLPGQKLPDGIYNPIDKVAVMPRVSVGEPFMTLVEGKTPSSGVIMIEDDGRIWLVSPKNEYGGYVNTFPKGGASSTATIELQRAAIREVFEESGLQSEIIGYLGDYEKNTSITRYYVGRRIGGSPVMMGSESQAVKLVTQKDLKELLNKSIDKTVGDDLLKMIQRAVELGDGNITKGIALIAEDKLAVDELAELMKKWPDIHMNFSGIKRDAEKIKTAEKLIDTHIAAKMDIWAHSPGTAEFVAMNKMPKDLPNRESYEFVVREADKLEKAAIERLSMKMNSIEKEAMRRLKLEGAIADSDTAYVKSESLKEKVRRMYDDAIKEKEEISKATGSVENYVFTNYRLLTGKDKPADMYDFVTEIKQIAEVMSNDARKQFDSIKASIGDAKFITISNEISLIDPKFHSRNIVDRLDQYLMFEKSIAKDLADIDAILATSDTLRTRYLSEVPADLPIANRLRALKKLEVEETRLSAAHETVKAALKDTGESIGKTLKDLDTPDVRAVTGTLRWRLVKEGKVPLDSTRMMKVWDSLSVAEHKRLLDMWIRKGATIPDEFLTKYYRSGMVSKASETAVKEKIVSDAIIIERSSSAEGSLKRIVIGTFNSLDEMIAKVGVDEIKRDIASGDMLYWSRLTSKARGEIRAAKTAAKKELPKYIDDYLARVVEIPVSATTLAREAEVAARIKEAEEAAKLAIESARIKAVEDAARIKEVEEAARIKAAEDAARIKAAEDAAKLAKETIGEGKSGKTLKDLDVSDVRAITGTLRWRLVKEGKIPLDSTRMMKVWESLSSAEHKRLLGIWTRKGATVPEAFVKKYTSDAVKEAIVTASTPKDIPPLISKDTKLDLANFRKYKEATGSNTGGFYVNKDNPADRWYFKFPDDNNKVLNELLAGRLYQAAGVEVPDIILVQAENGQLGIASRLIDGIESNKTALIDGSIRSGVYDNFVVDAWLGNWDVVGNAFDNLLIKDGVRGIRIDVGGSLIYRAQGKLKAPYDFGKTVKELATMTNLDESRPATKVFKNITKEELRAGAAKVLRIKDSDIRKIVMDFGPGSVDEKLKLADLLIDRKKYIEETFAEIDTAAIPTGKKELTEITQQTLKVADKRGALNDNAIDRIINFAKEDLKISISKKMIEDVSKKIEKEMLFCTNIKIQDADSAVYKSLMKDPTLKNQFVLGDSVRSSGSHCPWKGSQRDRWEKILSDGILQTNRTYIKMKNNARFITPEEIEAAFERPDYGFVLDSKNIEAADQYGYLTAVYKEDAKLRATFTMRNSSAYDYNRESLAFEHGTAANNTPLLKQFIRRATKSDDGYNIKGLKDFIEGKTTFNQIGLNWRNYIEAQVYGKNFLMTDIKYFVWRKTLDVPDFIKTLANRCGVKVYDLQTFKKMLQDGTA